MSKSSEWSIHEQEKNLEREHRDDEWQTQGIVPLPEVPDHGNLAERAINALFGFEFYPDTKKPKRIKFPF